MHGRRPRRHHGWLVVCGSCTVLFGDMRRLELAGQRFGRLTVISLHPERAGDGKSLWLCRCDCGTERVICGAFLRSGHSASCGCLRGHSPIDMTGQRFGRWTAVALYPEKKGKHLMSVCRCDCGNESVVNGQNLRSGKSSSCGCAKAPSDLAGRRFGRWTVKSFIGKTASDELLWLCVCDCGAHGRVTGAP
jgi:hypothetical protein